MAVENEGVGVSEPLASNGESSTEAVATVATKAKSKAKAKTKPKVATKAASGAKGGKATAAKVKPAKNVVAFNGYTIDEIRSHCLEFKNAADPTRIALLLTMQELVNPNVTEMCKRLNQSQPGVSHHLALLRVGGLVTTLRDGKVVRYSLSSVGESVLDGWKNVRDEVIKMRLSV